jgi:hypothetical protein
MCLVGLLKGYIFLITFGLFKQTPLRENYTPFVFRREGQAREERLREIGGNFFERLAPYDGQFYLDISRYGYRQLDNGTSEKQQKFGNYAFFPLLPLLLWIGGRIFGDPIPAVILLNLLLSVAALSGVGVLASHYGLNKWLVIGLLLCYPTAVFQNLLYAESLFLCISVGTAICVLRNHWKLGASLAYLASLSRPHGILLSFLLLVEWWRSVHVDQGGVRGRIAICRFGMCLTPVMGVATVAIVNQLYTGSLWSFLTIQHAWGRAYSITGIFKSLADVITYGGPAMDQIGLVFGIVLLPVVWYTLPRSLAVYATAMTLFPLLTGSLLSIGRFSSVSFAHFLGCAKLLGCSRLLYSILLSLCVVIQVQLLKAVLGWYFVG